MRVAAQGCDEKAERRRKRRLDGKGLTLDAFATAKSAPFFNPARIRKQRELYENAKKVKKYKKLVTQLAHQQGIRQPRLGSEVLRLQENFEGSNGDNEELDHKADIIHAKRGRDVNEVTWTQRRKKKKGSSYLEKLREDYEKKKQEEEKARKEREELIAAKKEAQLKYLKARKDARAKMWKKTHSGQPVMKYRLEHLLDTLQKEQEHPKV